METGCWRRRRRPEGSQRPERRRQRPERPDPYPHPGAGRAQPLRARGGHSLLVGSGRVRAVGERGAGAADTEVSGPPRGRGLREDAPRRRAEPQPPERAGLRPAVAARPARPEGVASCGLGGVPARVCASGGASRPWAVAAVSSARSPAFSSARALSARNSGARVPSLLLQGTALRERSGCQSPRSPLGVQAASKFSGVPPTHHVPPERSPSPPAMPAVFKRNPFWCVPAELGE